MSASSGDKGVKPDGWGLSLLQALFWYWVFGVFYFGDFRDESANPALWFLSLGSSGGFPSLWEWMKFLLLPPLLLLAVIAGWYLISVLLADHIIPFADSGLSSIRAKSRFARKRLHRWAWGLVYIFLCISPVALLVAIAWLLAS